MTDPSRLEVPSGSASCQRPSELLRTFVIDPESPQPDEVQRLVAELDIRQKELERQNEELRQTQRQLEAYRDRYVDLYDFAPLGYVTLDEDGYVQEINLAGAKMLGEDRNALTGYAFSAYVAEEDQQAFQEHLRKCAGERVEVTAELRLLTKDGQSLAVHLHSMPIEGPKEDALCKTAITDITRRMNMEEALRQSRIFLQTVIDAIPDALLVIGPDYRISLANRAAREQAGIDPAACLTCYQLSRRRGLPCAGEHEPCPLGEVIATRAPTRVTHAHCDADGKEVFIEVIAAPVLNVAGEVSHIIEARRDITDRKLAEDAILRERTLLRTLIDNLPDCIYVKDREGRFLAANLPTARLMGAATPQDLLGKTDGDFYPAERAAEYRADEGRVMRSGQPLLDKDEPHLDANGAARSILTTKVPLKDCEGQVVGLVGITRDISERKRAEQSILQLNARLQTANRDLEAFTSSVCHDLRRPLHTIGGFSQILASQYAASLDGTAKEYLDHICNGVRQMTELIDDLMNLSRVTRSEIRRAAVDLSALVQSIAEELRRAQPEREVEFVVREGACAEGDPRLLRLALENLLGNAWKFTGKHPKARIEFGAREQDGKQVYFIRDDGAGFDMTYAQKLFGVFQRMHSAQEFDGTGVGLATVERIIRAHGGRVWAEAAVERGATIFFTLPPLSAKDA